MQSGEYNVHMDAHRKEPEALEYTGPFHQPGREPPWFQEWFTLSRRMSGSGFNDCKADLLDDLPVIRIAGKVAPSLPAVQEAVLRIITDLARPKVIGRAICAEFRRRHGRFLAQGTLTRHIIPKLERCGVRNDEDHLGYYIRPR